MTSPRHTVQFCATAAFGWISTEFISVASLPFAMLKQLTGLPDIPQKRSEIDSQLETQDCRTFLQSHAQYPISTSPKTFKELGTCHMDVSSKAQATNSASDSDTERGPASSRVGEGSRAMARALAQPLGNLHDNCRPISTLSPQSPSSCILEVVVSIPMLRRSGY